MNIPLQGVLVNGVFTWLHKPMTLIKHVTSVAPKILIYTAPQLISVYLLDLFELLQSTPQAQSLTNLLIFFIVAHICLSKCFATHFHRPISRFIAQENRFFCCFFGTKLIKCERTTKRESREFINTNCRFFYIAIHIYSIYVYAEFLGSLGNYAMGNINVIRIFVCVLCAWKLETGQTICYGFKGAITFYGTYFASHCQRSQCAH